MKPLGFYFFLVFHSMVQWVERVEQRYIFVQKTCWQNNTTPNFYSYYSIYLESIDTVTGLLNNKRFSHRGQDQTVHAMYITSNQNEKYYEFRSGFFFFFVSSLLLEIFWLCTEFINRFSSCSSS